MENQFAESDKKKISLMESLRLRPAMYVGDLSTKGICTVIESVVLNLISSARLEEVDIELTSENTIRISSSDIAVDALIKKFNALNDVPSLNNQRNIQPLSVIIGLSESINIEVYNAGKIYILSGGKGEFALNIDEGYLTEDLIIYFTPDRSIFKTTDINFEYLCSVFRRIAYINSAVKITCIDNMHDDFQECVFYYPNGIFNRMDVLILERSCDQSSLRLDIDKERDGFRYKISLCLPESGISSYVQSFAGYTETFGHGSLIDGAELGIIRSIKDFVNKNNLEVEIPDNIIKDKGFILIASVIGSSFQYEGALKIKLEQPEIKIAAEEIVYNELGRCFGSNRDKAIKTIERFIN
ncbi:hypothetical protein JGH11_02255 [Dysgonomonas sp. Marseille-P4677]|uniref:hypothetical protein n=1 Tax=Dysgonomonas sp. Marseille-P4677 TaxID=2364790 RepID=UPI001911E6C0|nr:hypothetical protein [Dysgonomonas sp. Marseille-P4677]MBK5719688.1 hypothetical protein [Dysgonomonas sp. Marseille-P4677]